MEFTDLQRILYVLRKGVIVYKGKTIDYFSNKSEDFEIAQKIVNNVTDKRYCGEMKIQDKIVLSVISDGKKMNEYKKGFQESFNEMIEKNQKIV